MSETAQFISLALVGVFLAALFSLRVLMATRRRRAHYQSGLRQLVERAVRQELALGHSPDQLRTLALASVGEFSPTRRALLCQFGHAGERRELLICAHVLAEAFEGQSERALSLCHDLLGVPLRSGGARGRRRRARREATVAVARAVGGVADAGDYAALLRASSEEPSMYWACRYGAAVACWAKREQDLVAWLVRDAPRWPEDSAFRRLHARLCTPRDVPGQPGLARVA